MSIEALQKYRTLVRPLLFGLVIAVHIIVLLCVRFSVKGSVAEEEIDAEIFKLVDVEEFIPPPPPPAFFAAASNAFTCAVAFDQDPLPVSRANN
jgi:hypothetical protein